MSFVFDNKALLSLDNENNFIFKRKNSQNGHLYSAKFHYHAYLYELSNGCDTFDIFVGHVIEPVLLKVNGRDIQDFRMHGAYLVRNPAALENGAERFGKSPAEFEGLLLDALAAHEGKWGEVAVGFVDHVDEIGFMQSLLPGDW